ncbi:NPCBM/NEW2 domain-containing protein [Microbacterium sp. NPDC091313]
MNIDVARTMKWSRMSFPSPRVARRRRIAVPLAAVMMLAGVAAAPLTTATPAAAAAIDDSAGAAAPAIDLGEQAATPPMGFSTWNEFGCDITADLILEMAHAIVDSGMREAGYEYVNIDDCWAQATRDAEGNLVADPVKFPEGIAGLADDIHALGLKVGIYSSAGATTCQRVYPGGLGYEYIDATNYADWGVDYIKYDNCGDHALTDEDFTVYGFEGDVWMAEDLDQGELSAERRYERMGAAIQQVQQDRRDAGEEWNVVLSICEWGDNEPWVWGTSVGGVLWRTTQDITDTFASVLSILDQQVGLEAYSGPNAWNDPDMLEVGNGGMTLAEYRTHFSLWALLNAPLIAGNDIRLMDTAAERDADPALAGAHAILTNADVIAVDQDWGGSQGFKVRDDGDTEVWAKPMSDGESTAVVLLNRGLESATVSVAASELGDAGLTQAGAYTIDDLWDETETSTTGTVRAALDGHASRMFILSPNGAAVDPAVTVEVTGDRYVQAGQSTTVDVTVHDDGALDLADVALTLDAPDGWQVEATTAAAADVVSAGSALTATYEMTATADAAVGDAPVVATARYRVAGDDAARSATASYLLHLVTLPGDGVTWISDLPWVRSSNTGAAEVGRDVSTDGTALQVAGTVYDKGVGTQSPGTVVVYLGDSCTEFSSLVGVQQGAADNGNDGGGGPALNGQSAFEVWGDGELLWSTEAISAADAATATGAVDISGVEVLELRTLDGGGFFTAADKGNWLQAAVTCAADGTTPEQPGTPGDGDGSGDDDGAIAPSLSVSSATVRAGQTQTVTGTGFAAGASYSATLYSDPVALGAVTADAAGRFVLTFTVPAGTDAGTHSVVVSSSAGEVARVSFAVTAAAGSGGLAATGMDGSIWLPVSAVALALVLLGALAVVRRRRAG